MPAKRYGFWKVFWTVLGVNLLFITIGIIVTTIAPMPNEGKGLSELFTWERAASHLFSFCFMVLYYFFSVNIFYSLMQRKEGAISYIKVILIALVAFVGYYVATVYLFSLERVLKEKIPIGFLIFSYAITSTAYIGISLLISYLTFLRDEKKQQKILEEQKRQLEVEKSTSNFNFLRAQINPHFLHNTLNFLYAKSLPYSAELSEGILTLSDIMRYALEETTAREGKALLKDEIAHVRNVIKINQLRYNNNLKVQFDVEGVANGATIIPFVLITLVENAFKHGELKNPEEPIDVRLKIEDQRFYFYCRNKKKSGPKELSTGIGLDNIRKRLDLTYGTSYCFKVTDEENFYTTELTIDPL